MQVSVIIPVYNAENYVQQAVESALAQPETSEVILVEDGSSDNSLQVCTDIATQDSKIRVLRHESGKNLGESASRNLGIQNASCEYVANLDADDYFLPGRFTNTKIVFSESPYADGVYEPVRVFFENGEAQAAWFRLNNSDLNMLTEFVPAENLLAALLGGCKGHIQLDGLVLKKRIFKKVGFFDEQIIVGPDTEMIARLAAVGNLVSGKLDEPVAMRRIHNNNISLSAKYRNEIRLQRFILWQSLFNWSLRSQIQNEKVDLFAERYLFQGRRGCGNDSILARGLLRWKVLIEVFRKHPGVVGKRYFWHHLARACDLTKLKYLTTGMPEI